MRAVNTANVSYSSACGNGGYAVLFASLARPRPLAARLSSRRTSDGGVLAAKSGFDYTLVLAWGESRP